ncbi:MAG: autotransporter outer membrane beta-barrel domain-containing protein, partial [Selenomonas sp.]|nr:autotransporter outer membrane beta-barrel domain-containing protein [Selenomonas sp.]
MTLAVLSSLAMPLSYTAAAEADPYLATQYSDYNGKHFAELKFLKTNYGIGAGGDKWLVDSPTYDLPAALMAATKTSTDYWTNILGPGAKNSKPWQIFVTTYDKQNASAGSHSINSDGKHPASDSFYNAEFYLGEQLQQGKVFTPLTYEEAQDDLLPAGQYAYSMVVIGKYMGAKRNQATAYGYDGGYGWWIDSETVLPTNEQANDFVGAFRHELGHALGISLATATDKNGNLIINNNITDKNSWTLHLRDQNDNPAQAGLPIVDTEDVKGSAKNYFVVDEDITNDGKGYAYFYGDHVTEVLDGAKFFGRSALPVNGWEDDDDNSNTPLKFDGAHLQTAGMMSHRPYSNYTTFLEVELAVMQDLGYKIDRKAFFGRSIYGNGGNIINNQGYFARNADGTEYLANTYSLVPLGVGLHIYGSDN